MAMTWARTWLSRTRHLLRRLLRRAQVEQELDDEVQGYLEALVERGVASGLAPDEARRRARLAMEGAEQVKQQVREARVAAWLETTFQDLRQGWRGLRRSPGFTAFAALTIALCLGANAAMFSLVDGVLLKSIEYPEPERIVQLWEKPPRGARNGISAANYLDWAAQSRSFEAIAAQAGAHMTYTDGGEPRSVRVGRVSAGYFDVFAARPALGRTFARDEDQPDRAAVAVLSHRGWIELGGGDPGIVGRGIRLDGRTHTVIGVLPGDGVFDRRQVEAWVPLTFPAQVARDYHYLLAFARLKRGVTLEQAQAEMSLIAGRIAEQYPAIKRGWGATVDRLVDLLVRPQTRLSLVVLMVTVVVVLLIGCANLANLMMARATLRGREIAVRLALGARRGRLIRMLLTESLLLAGCGLVLGIGLGRLLLAWIQGLLPPGYLPAEARIALDGRVLLFLAGATVLTTVGFGLAPALRASRGAASDALKEGARGASAGRRKLRARHVFVAAQVAVAFVLLVGAGLLVRSLRRVLDVDLGYRTEGLVAGQLPLAMEDPDPGVLGRYVQRLLEAVRAEPGIQAAAVATALPLRGWGDSMPMFLPGRLDDRRSTGFKVVSHGYFQTLGLRLLAGRLLDGRDTAGSAPVVVVNQSFVKQHFPDQDPLGKAILIQRLLPARRGLGPRQSWEIVGVVADEKARGPESPTDVGAYASYAQVPVVGVGLVARGSGDGAAVIAGVRRALARVDRSQMLASPLTLDELRQRSLMGRRLPTMLLGAFALLALLLACAGIYGVLSFVTARRTQEMGIRAALGATRAALLRLVLVGGAAPVLAGIALGLAGALGLTRVLESLLFATSPTDVPNLVAVSALFLLVALAACLVPAWRAAAVPPMVALREE
jgi:putative ABC transport system permease protein